MSDATDTKWVPGRDVLLRLAGGDAGVGCNPVPLQYTLGGLAIACQTLGKLVRHVVLCLLVPSRAVPLLARSLLAISHDQLVLGKALLGQLRMLILHRGALDLADAVHEVTSVKRVHGNGDVDGTALVVVACAGRNTVQ